MNECFQCVLTNDQWFSINYPSNMMNFTVLIYTNNSALQVDSSMNAFTVLYHYVLKRQGKESTKGHSCHLELPTYTYTTSDFMLKIF